MEYIKNIQYANFKDGFETWCEAQDNKIIVDDKYAQEVWVYTDDSIMVRKEGEDPYERVHDLEYMIRQGSWKEDEYDIDFWHDSERNNWVCTVTPIVVD